MPVTNKGQVGVVSRGAAIWDWPTRLFHWLLAALFAYCWWTADHDEMDQHLTAGVILLGLLAFRLTWGFIGGSTARFGHFIQSPRRVLDYLRTGSASPLPGHNPLGGYSVVALLLMLFVQVLTGLFAVDVDGIESGPLSAYVSFDQGRLSAHIHHLAFNLLLGLIGLHVAAIAFYRLRGRDLLRPMLIGRDRQIEPGDAELVPAPTVHFVLAVAIAAGLAWWIEHGLRI